MTEGLATPYTEEPPLRTPHRSQPAEASGPAAVRGAGGTLLPPAAPAAAPAATPRQRGDTGQLVLQEEGEMVTTPRVWGWLRQEFSPSPGEQMTPVGAFLTCTLMHRVSKGFVWAILQ